MLLFSDFYFFRLFSAENNSLVQTTILILVSLFSRVINYLSVYVIENLN